MLTLKDLLVHFLIWCAAFFLFVKTYLYTEKYWVAILVFLLMALIRSLYKDTKKLMKIEAVKQKFYDRGFELVKEESSFSPFLSAEMHLLSKQNKDFKMNNGMVQYQRKFTAKRLEDGHMVSFQAKMALSIKGEILIKVFRVKEIS